MDTSDSPRKVAEKRDTEEAEVEGGEKKQRTEDEGEKVAAAMESSGRRSAEHIAEGSPTKKSRLYPPHDAGVESILAHGGEEVGLEYAPEKV